MPSPDTFSIGPIRNLLAVYLRDCKTIIDPFARNGKVATITNDLNPETSADFHMDAAEFTDMLVKKGTRADAVLFDPPYSPRQVVECYSGFGRKVTMRDAQQSPIYNAVKEGMTLMLRPGGVAICCGWNSAGFGAQSLFDLEEILLVPHGGLHNDTIVTVERKRQGDLFQ